MYKKYRYLDTDIHVYQQTAETIRSLQSNKKYPLSKFFDEEKEVKAIINCSYFTDKYVLGRNQGDLKNDTHDQSGFYDLVFLKDGSYKLGEFKSWDYQNNALAGFSVATVLIEKGKDVAKISTAITNGTKLIKKSPQTAIAVLNSGKVLFIVSDGRAAQNKGLSGYELREFIKNNYDVELLCQLDGGGSSEMIVDGKIVNKPSDGAERKMFNGLALLGDEKNKPQQAILKFKDYKGVEMMSGISQGQKEGTHILLSGANDFNGRGASDRVDLLAPYDCVVKAIGAYDNTCFFESLTPVKTPSGTYSKCWFMCTHMLDSDKQLLGIKVGKIFKQGEACYTEGTKGIGAGNHIHFESGVGKFNGTNAPYYKSKDIFTFNGKVYAQFYPCTDGQEKPIADMFYLDKNIDYSNAKSALDRYKWVYLDDKEECDNCKSLKDEIEHLKAQIKVLEDEKVKLEQEHLEEVSTLKSDLNKANAKLQAISEYAQSILNLTK